MKTMEIFKDIEGYEIGKRIIELLDEKHMTQRELAARCGITEVSISRFVTGKRIPRAASILAISKELGVTTDYLLGASAKRW